MQSLRNPGNRPGREVRKNMIYCKRNIQKSYLEYPAGVELLGVSSIDKPEATRVSSGKIVEALMKSSNQNFICRCC